MVTSNIKTCIFKKKINSVNKVQDYIYYIYVLSVKVKVVNKTPGFYRTCNIA